MHLVADLRASVAGGGPVLRASLVQGALLASHCIVIANHYLDTIHDCPSQLWQVSSDAKKTKRQRQRRMSRKTIKRENERRAAALGLSDASSSSDEDPYESEAGSSEADAG